MPVMPSKRPSVLQPTVKTTPKVEKKLPLTTSTPDLGVTVDTRYQPANSLLRYVNGSSWTVDYYSQVKGRHDDLDAQNTSLAAPYQQYLKIHGLELKVQSALSTTQDTQTKEMEIQGDAVMYPGVIPNKGDMFVADIGDGRYGHFVITESEKKSVMKDSVYAITYTMKGYLTQKELSDLEEKVVRETYWVKDYLSFGQNPQVVADEYHHLIRQKDEYRRLIAAFFSDFFSDDCQTLIVPDQDTPTYDPMLVDAVMDWVDVDEHPAIRHIRRYRVTSRNIMRSTSLWDALSQVEDALLMRAISEVVLVPSCAWRTHPELGGLYYSNIQYWVMPNSGRTDADRGHDPFPDPKPDGRLMSPGQRRWRDIHRMSLKTQLDGLRYTNDEGELPLVVPVTDHETYVMSPQFYATPGPRSSIRYASQLEALVMKTLRGEAIDRKQLLELVEASHHWSSVDRFYYQAILIALMRLWLRSHG